MDTAHVFGSHRYRIHAVAGITRSPDALIDFHVGHFLMGRPLAARDAYGQSIQLPNGDVLAFDSHNTQRYVVSQREWILKSAMPANYGVGAPVVLTDGSILTIGAAYGDVGGMIPTITGFKNQIFDPVLETWTEVDTLQTYIPGQPYLMGSLLTDGRVLAVGFYSDRRLTTPSAYLPMAEIYSPVTKNFSLASLPPHGFHVSTAAPLANGKVLVAGGMIADVRENILIDSCYLYDSSQDQWTPAPRLSAPRWGHKAVSMLNGAKVIVLGGYEGPYTYEIYDGTTNSWSAPAHLDEWVFAVHKESEEILYVVSGYKGSSGFLKVYNAASDSWTFIAEIPRDLMYYPYHLHRLPNGRFLLLGVAEGPVFYLPTID
jgi:hypothetical protein